MENSTKTTFIENLSSVDVTTVNDSCKECGISCDEYIDQVVIYENKPLDLSGFTLSCLQCLHISFNNVLEKFKIQLVEMSQSESCCKLHILLLNKKIKSTDMQIRLIINKINELNMKELRFSREYLLWNFGIFENSIQIHFLTTSRAYYIYGPYITGYVIFDKSELPSLLNKISQKQYSDGVIKFAEYVKKLPVEIAEKLKIDGFYASEIDSIIS